MLSPLGEDAKVSIPTSHLRSYQTAFRVTINRGLWYCFLTFLHTTVYCCHIYPTREVPLDYLLSQLSITDPSFYALQVDVSDVEMWVVEAISQSPPLLEASMDQFNSVVTVTYVLCRTVQCVAFFVLFLHIAHPLSLPHHLFLSPAHCHSTPFISIRRCVHRSFGPDQWKGLQQRLKTLRASVAVVLDSAKKYNN